MTGMTVSAAARDVSADRRTVQRYCRRHPWILENGKVNVFALRLAIEQQKARDARGFPLGKKRNQPSMRLRAVRKEKPILRRTLKQRIEIILREIDAMTDAEQAQILQLGPQGWLRMFRVSKLLLCEGKVP